MPPVLYDELVAPWSVTHRDIADSIAEVVDEADQGDQLIMSHDDVYLTEIVDHEGDVVEGLLANGHLQEDESEHDQLTDAALIDLLSSE